MKHPPEKIYLQYYGADKDDLTEEELNTDPVEVTWCTDKMFDTDVEYERVHKTCRSCGKHHGWSSLGYLCSKCYAALPLGSLSLPGRAL